MNTCQHCGDPTPGPRSKQCTACRDIKDNAYRLGTYSKVMEAFAAGQAAGLQGADLRQAVNAADTATWIALRQEQARREADQQARKDARRAHEAEIGRKLAAGWRWLRVDEESEDSFGATAYADQYGSGDGHWQLVPPAEVA